jgi:hypothetical protein
LGILAPEFAATGPGIRRYIISWKLRTTMTAGDVTDTLDLALAASGCDSSTVLHKPRLLSDNGRHAFEVPAALSVTSGALMATAPL